MDADAWALDELGNPATDEVADRPVQHENLLVQQQPAPTEAGQRDVQPAGRRQLAGAPGELQQALHPHLVTKLLVRTDVEGLDLVARCHGRLDRAVAGSRQCPQIFYCFLAVLRHGRGLPGENRTSSGFGIDGVALALAAPVGSVGSVHLDDSEAGGLQRAGELVAVAAGALGAGGQRGAVSAAPRDELGGAGVGGGDLKTAW